MREDVQHNVSEVSLDELTRKKKKDSQLTKIFSFTRQYLAYYVTGRKIVFFLDICLTTAWSPLKLPWHKMFVSPGGGGKAAPTREILDTINFHQSPATPAPGPSWVSAVYTQCIRQHDKVHWPGEAVNINDHISRKTVVFYNFGWKQKSKVIDLKITKLYKICFLCSFSCQWGFWQWQLLILLALEIWGNCSGPNIAHPKIKN